jgi:hypothetical protein
VGVTVLVQVIKMTEIPNSARKFEQNVESNHFRVNGSRSNDRKAVPSGPPPDGTAAAYSTRKASPVSRSRLASACSTA